ncbi:MAG TPA: hypothetical protein VKP59_04635 [Candidatus Thermoplasmatota archaeon]|nr:hypothetical protein [Candidatus Thermoplasmatota archaeon]
MGRRKRKQNTYRPKRTPPKIFECPSCGKKTMKAPVKRKNEMVTVRCGHCGIEETVDKNALTEPVDAFGDFIDVYYKDREYDRLLERVDMLWDKEQYTELTLVYSFLADIARINAEKALEAFEKNKNPEDLDNAEMWQQAADEYNKNREQLKAELEAGLIQDADLKDEIYDSSENDLLDEGERDKVVEKPKKRTDIEDILGDTGFLEF